MTTFYRYIRPIRFDPKRVDVQTYARGGVCLRFEAHADGSLWFAHSRCHPDELFSKDIAKKIAYQRAYGTDPIIRSQMAIELDDTLSMTLAVINWCLTWSPIPYPPIIEYAKAELRQLGHALDEIVILNSQEHQKMADWQAIQESAHYKDDYDRLSR